MDKLLLDELSQPTLDLFNGFENDLLINISGQFALNKGLLDTDPLAWKIQMMNNLGLLTRENLVLMAKQSGLTAGGINGILLNAGLDGVEVNEEILAKATKKGARLQVPPPVSESPKILEILKSYEKQAKDVLNLTNQTMLNQAGKIYVDIINRTAFDVISGTMTGDQALRKTIKQWGETGVPALIDSAGRRWSPEGYVRTVIKTTVGNVTNEMQDARFDEYGVDYVEISSHAGARPKCEPYQGRVFSINSKAKKYPHISTTSQGQVDGLFGINCGHTKYAFIPGISTQTFQPYDTEENNKIYKESQHQRAIERSIRKAKTQKSMLEASGDLKGSLAMDKTISLRQAKMRKFIKDTGRTRRSGREQVVSLKGIKPLPVKPIKKGHIKTIEPVKVIKPKTVMPDPPKPALADIIKAKKVELSDFAQTAIKSKNAEHIRSLKEMSSNKMLGADAQDNANKLLKEYEAGKYDNVYTKLGYGDGSDLEVFEYEHDNGSSLFFRIEPGTPKDIEDLARESFKQAEKFKDIIKGAVVEINKGSVAGYNKGNGIIRMSHKSSHRKVTADNGTGFLDTLMHEIGHREHYSQLTDKEWSAFKKAINKHYSAKSVKMKDIGLGDADRDWELVVNAKHWATGGTKDDFFYEMYAEGLSIFTTGNEKEKAIMQKVFPDMFDFFNKKYGGKKILPKVKPVKKDLPKPIDPRFTKAEILEANEENLRNIDEMLKSKFTTIDEMKDLRKLQKEYKAGKWDHTKTFIDTDMNGRYKVVIDIPTIKPKPVIKPDVNTEIIELNKANIDILTKKLNDRFVKSSNVPILEDLIKEYKSGKWDNIKTTIALDERGRPFIKRLDGTTKQKLKPVVKPLIRPEVQQKVKDPIKPKPTIKESRGIKNIKKGDMYKAFSDEQFEDMVELIESMPKDVRDLFYKYGDRLRLDLNQSGSFYRPSTGRISLARTGVGIGGTRYSTLFHEVGHFMDAILGKISYRAEYKNAIAADYKNYLDKIRASVKNGKLSDEQTFFIASKKILKHDINSIGAQDVFNGLSHGKIRVDFAHGQDYWERRDRLQEAGSELFAHMVEATTSPEKIAVMEEFFPTAWKEFLDMLKPGSEARILERVNEGRK